MGCAYRNEEMCSFKGGLCEAAEYNPFSEEYEINYIKERNCKNYKGDSVFGFDMFSAKKSESKTGDVVTIKIFGNIVPYQCSTGSCSIPDSPDIDAEVLQGLFDRKFNCKVKVKFIDVMSDEMERYPEVVDIVFNQGSQPVVTINDQVKFVGSIPVEKIKEELRKLGLEE